MYNNSYTSITKKIYIMENLLLIETNLLLTHFLNIHVTREFLKTKNFNPCTQIKYLLLYWYSNIIFTY